MSRKIHHGHNGSYKTSGALNDDLMPAVRSGRTVVSNVRGLEDKQLIIKTWYLLQPLTTRLFWKLFPSKAPMIDFELIYIDTECKDNGEENMEKMRRWMEWIPKGSLIIFDEIDEIYDTGIFTTSHLKNYDYPAKISEHGELLKTSKQASIADGRWQSLRVAFSKHRHYNLDMIFTCTSIDNVHPMIRKGADMAYRHFNMANAGVMGKGQYREIAHSPDNKGATDSSEISNATKKIPKRLFDIYKSTSTGEVQDTVAGTGIWKGNRKVRYLTYFIVILLIKSLWDIPHLLDQFDAEKIKEAENAKTKQIQESSVSKRVNPYQINKVAGVSTDKNSQVEKGDEVSNISSNSSVDTPVSKIAYFADEFLGDRLILSGHYVVTGKVPAVYAYFKNPRTKQIFNIETLSKVGFKIEWIDSSTGFLVADNVLIPFAPGKQDIKDFCCLAGHQRNNISVTTPTFN